MKNFINRALVAKKHLKLFFALFAMLALNVGNAWGAEKITDYSKIGTGKTYYIGATTGGTDYYLSVSGASTSTSIAGTAKTDKANATAFVFTGSGTSWTIKFADYANYLGLNSSKDNGKVQVVSSAATFTASNQSGKLRLSIGSYSIQKNNSGTQFGSYGNTQTDIWLEEVPGSSEPTTQYTVKWYTAIGSSDDVKYDEGATINKPATDPTMSGYEFMGWTDQCSVAEDGTGFTALTNFGTADSDKEFYAVFAVEEITSGGGSSNYEKVTSNLTDWAGDYLIAYNNTTFADGRTGGTSGMGAQNKKVDLSSSLSNNTIPASVGDQYNVTLEAVTGGYVLKTKDGNYNYQASNANGLATTTTIATAAKYAITVTFTSENDIKLALTGTAAGAVFRYNTQGYFRFYKNGGQSAVYLYKKTSGGGSTTTYDNYITTCSGSTPVENLKDAQFAWSAATAEATMGASNTFPTLTNTLSVPVTYESSTPATATIAADGSIALVAPGTTTISAKFAGGEVGGTTYAAKTVTYALTVLKAPATPTENVYVKVTETAGITDGEYLIVYEDAEGNPKAPVAFDGSLAPVKLDVASNNIEVSIASNTIAGNTDIDAATFTINTAAGTIQTKDGYYIGQTSNANGLATSTTTEYTNTISIENDGSATIISSGGAYLRYNSANDNLRFRYFKSSTYTAQKAIALYKKASKHTVTIADCTNGSVSASVANGAQVLSGTAITLTPNAKTSYKLSAYDVYKTGDNTTKVTVDGNTFIMPEFDVTISATFELAKTLTGIEITTTDVQKTFWQGETFNSTGLKVTAHFDGAADEDVTDKVTVTGNTATSGTQTITVSYNEGATTKTATYNITVKDIPNTKETAYSVADAFDIIDKLGDTEGIYITGTISQVDSYNSTYKSITYWISADGTTTNQLQVYGGKGLDNADFASKLDLTVGDQVIVVGNLKKYNSTYEFDANNYLASHTPTTKDPAGLEYTTTEYTANVGEAFATPVLTNPHGLAVSYSTSDASKATVDVNTGAVTIVAAGEVTITASTTGDAYHDAGSASYTITISNPATDVATLPFAFNENKAAIEATAGMTQNGLGSDYSASTAPNTQLKFDGTGDWVVIRFDSEPEKLSYDIKNNSFSGGTFSVQESADGETYTDVEVHTEITNTQNEEHTLLSTSRYVKFIYTEKVDGNVGLGNIKIALPEEEPGEGGGETPEERLTDWVLTPLADITTNDLVVITMTKGETTWAMTNNNGTSAAPAAPVVTLSADALAAEPDANLKWVVSNDNGTLTIYPYGTYETWLYCTNTNNGVRVGTGEAKEFTIDTDHLYTTLTNDPRYLGVYDADADTWRCYTSINSNIEDQTLAFYVKKNANDILPGTGEEPGDDPVVPTPTINPTATFIFNTADGLTNLGITYPATPTTVEDGTEDAFKTEFENNATFTQDGITMTATNGSTPTRVWLTAAEKLDLRVYKGATLTFSVPAEHQISTIVFDGSNIGHLLVNGNAVSGNAWTGSAQTITFTAKDDAKTIKINTIAFVVEYTRNVTYTWGTICLPYASSSYSGAEFYEVSWLNESTGLYLDQLEAGAQLEAGKPYIFKATDSKITVTYTGDAKAAPVEGKYGLTGTFTDIAAGGVLVDNYIIAQNKIWVAGTSNTLPANRAYIDKDGVPTTEQPKLAGRRRVCMGENAATGLDNITNGEDTTIKVIENGQLIIIRNGEKFNAQGQKL